MRLSNGHQIILNSSYSNSVIIHEKSFLSMVIKKYKYTYIHRKYHLQIYFSFEMHSSATYEFFKKLTQRKKVKIWKNDFWQGGPFVTRFERVRVGPKISANASSMERECVKISVETPAFLYLLPYIIYSTYCFHIYTYYMGICCPSI